MSRKETFVGRADELATMGAELDRVRTGHPRVLWVSGPAGIGKTSLVRRLLDDRADVRVLRGDGDEGETGLPFGVLGQLVGDVPRRFLGPLLAAGPAPDADPLAVGAELLTVLGALQSSGPVVVVVDDAQWVDDADRRERSCSSGDGCAATRSSSWSRRGTTRRPSRRGGSAA